MRTPSDRPDPTPMRLRTGVLLILAALLALTLASCATGPASGRETVVVTASVDDDVAPPVAALPDASDGGPRPLATALFDGVPQSAFVANELIVVPTDSSALDAFLARWSGTVLETIETPGAATRYLVRVDASGVDIAGGGSDLSELAEESGDLVVSSQAGLQLLLLAARETLAGVDVSVNWTMEPSTFEDGSQEDGRDAMLESYMEAGRNQDIGVDQAWLALERAGVLSNPANRIGVGVIDGGFYDNDDFATPSTHISYVQGDAALGSPSPVSCTGGAACPRHGTGAALTLAGLADNGFGGAGPAGPIVGQLTTAHVALDAASVMAAASAMQANGTFVINMSFGGTLSGTWAWWSLDDYADHLSAIASSGVALVAAAGNENTNVDSGETSRRDPSIHYPCEFQNVICVGALANDSTDRISYSNYGGINRASGVYSQGTVDLWAPTNIVVADTANPGDLRTFGGTSAASPFAAGIIALIRSADPTVPLGDSYGALWSTANSGSADAEVGVWPNARDAVLQILGDVPARIDVVEPSAASYDEFDSIPLRADLVDLDSSVAPYDIRWSYEDARGTSVLLGTTKSGDTLSVQLCDGSYEIVADAIQPFTSANVSASVAIEVTQPAVPPTRCAPEIVIVRPDTGATFASGDPITFEAVIDDDDDSTDQPIFPVVWRQDGPASTILAQNVLSFDENGLAPGSYDIYVAYGSASDTVTIEVLDTTNSAPNVVIGDPDDGATLIYSDFVLQGDFVEIPVGGLAFDPDDSVFIGDADLTWQIRETGTLAWQEAGTGSVTTILFPLRSPSETWDVRLTATDSQGLAGTDVHTFTLIGPAN